LRTLYHLQRAGVLFFDRHETALFEPKKSDSQLPQIVSGMADRQFACPPQHVGDLPSER
jgi:hypothetical protein